MERERKINTAIIILAVLLGISIFALGGTLLCSRSHGRTPATATVPDNLITPEENRSAVDRAPVVGIVTASYEQSSRPAAVSAVSGNRSPAPQVLRLSSQASGQTGTQKKSATIELYNRQAEDNTPFAVENLFPGDSETQYFRVQVSYHDTVTVHFKATVRPGYEKLAEVLKIRVKLLTTGKTLYDGLMRDMPDSVTRKLSTTKTTTDALSYEITAYLDTSVGNAYQNQDLIADFRWWVEETANLSPSPKTGDTSGILLWTGLAAVSGGMIIFLLLRRRRKGASEND